MTELLFDKLAYTDRLKHAGISEDRARAHADAIEAALRESVATKSDIAAVKSDIADVRHAIELAVRDMTIRMGAVAIALFAALATIRFFP
jgi:hypothetical protein